MQSFFLKNISAKTILIVLTCLFYSGYSFSQSVGINYNASSANASALLDIDAQSGPYKGLLIPRIALASTTDASTISSPATSLLVYNTTTGSGLVPGYYYNSGTSG